MTKNEVGGHNGSALARAPLGHFCNTGGGAHFRAPPPPIDFRNYWTDSKNFRRHFKAVEKLSEDNKF